MSYSRVSAGTLCSVESSRSVKAIMMNVPAVELRRGMVAAAAGAALVISIATFPRFLHPINPAPAPMFTACIYVALAGLAALSVPTSRGVRAAVWAPTVAHLVLIAFASCSFFRRGHWPWYSFPDPKELHLPFFYGAAVISVLAGALSIPTGALMLGASTLDGWRDKRAALIHSATVLAFGTWLWIFEWRDRRLIDWLAD